MILRIQFPQFRNLGALFRRANPSGQSNGITINNNGGIVNVYTNLRNNARTFLTNARNYAANNFGGIFVTPRYLPQTPQYGGAGNIYEDQRAIGGAGALARAEAGRVRGGLPPAPGVAGPREEIAINNLSLEILRASITGNRNPAFPAINAGNMIAALDQLTGGERFAIPDVIPDVMANDDARPIWLRGYANAAQRRAACQYLINMTNGVLTAMPAAHERRAEATQFRDRLLQIQARQV